MTHTKKATEGSCAECQFEEGHSQGCSKYRAVFPHANPAEEWEEQFYKLSDQYYGYAHQTGRGKIKSFIAELLAAQKVALVDEIAAEIEALKGEKDFVAPEWNNALDYALLLVRSKKGV